MKFSSFDIEWASETLQNPKKPLKILQNPSNIPPK